MIYWEVSNVMPLAVAEEPSAAFMQKFDKDTNNLVFLRNKYGNWALFRKKDLDGKPLFMKEK